MSKKKQKFSDIWINQTNLGKQFGLSAIAMGKKLQELGLKNAQGKPTEQATAEEYCKSTPLKDGTPFFLWNRQKVENLMLASGAEKLDSKEVKARDLATAWLKLHKQVQKAVSSIEEDLLYEEAQELHKQAKRLGVIERVNQILQEHKCTDLMEK